MGTLLVNRALEILCQGSYSMGKKVVFPKGTTRLFLKAAATRPSEQCPYKKKKGKKKIYHGYTVFQGSLCCVSLGFYCKDHLAASMSQIPVLPTVASGKVKFPFPLLTKSKPKLRGEEVVPPDRKDDKFTKTWRRRNLMVKRCQSMPGRSCKRR